MLDLWWCFHGRKWNIIRKWSFGEGRLACLKAKGMVYWYLLNFRNQFEKQNCIKRWFWFGVWSRWPLIMPSNPGYVSMRGVAGTAVLGLAVQCSTPGWQTQGWVFPLLLLFFSTAGSGHWLVSPTCQFPLPFFNVFFNLSFGVFSISTKSISWLSAMYLLPLHRQGMVKYNDSL